MLSDIVAILFLFGGAFAILLILKDIFGEPPQRNRYAIPNDSTIRMDRRMSRKQRRISQLVLMAMIAMAMIGAILYLMRG